MQWEGVSKLPIILPNFTCKAYVVRAADVGAQLRFEWRYIHSLHVHLRTHVWRFLQGSDALAMLDRLEVARAEIVLGPKSGRGSWKSDMREHLVTTRALLGLVSHVASILQSSVNSKSGGNRTARDDGRSRDECAGEEWTSRNAFGQCCGPCDRWERDIERDG